MDKVFYLLFLCFLSQVRSQGEYDFGGYAFPFRDIYKTFATVESGKLINYGFYTPLFGSSALPVNSSNPNAYALVEYFSNLTTFEKFHDLLPFEFLHLHYNPAGHAGAPEESAWSLPHFDIHLSIAKPEFVRGIDCHFGHSTACETNPLFYNYPESIYFPTGTWIATDPVEQMGIHWYHQGTNYGRNAFMSHPANLFVSFDGQLIIHEPMASVVLIQNIISSTSKVASFSFPRPQRFAKPGLYFDTLEIRANVTENRMYFTCKDLYRAPEWYRDVPVYIGAPYTPPLPSTSVGLVSSSKNCYIKSETNGALDGGYEVSYGGSSYCCLKKMPYRFNSGTQQSECVHDCTFTPYTGNAFVEATLSRRCFAQCFERVPI